MCESHPHKLTGEVTLQPQMLFVHTYYVSWPGSQLCVCDIKLVCSMVKQVFNGKIFYYTESQVKPKSFDDVGNWRGKMCPWVWAYLVLQHHTFINPLTTWILYSLLHNKTIIVVVFFYSHFISRLLWESKANIIRLDRQIYFCSEIY